MPVEAADRCIPIPAAVQKSVRSYITVFVMLMVFTVITVAVSRFHFAVPIAIAIALIIAATKGSMVASGVHAPEPREAGDLRHAAPDVRVLLPAAVLSRS